MKRILIKRLALENFKCHDNLILDFDGKSATISGDNATGKTSIYDALTWLLFGKDSQGNGEKNVEIKPLNEKGEVRDHQAITSVEVVLLVDGEELSLRRTYREIWSTKRGSSEETYDGNSSEYYVDGVPCKKYAFTDKVNELVDEETFRLLTVVSHFASGIGWQERRAVLCRIAGVPEDRSIMETDTRFQPLLDGLGRLSLDDYKKKLLAEKKSYIGAKNDIPARMDECRKTITELEGQDFSAARAEIETLTAKKEGIESRILALDHDNATDQKRLELREARLELDKLEGENKLFRASQLVGTVNVSALKESISSLEARRMDREKRLALTNSAIKDMEADIAASRERWIETNNETFSGGACPTCGQALPEQQRKGAMDAFELTKRRHLREIEQTATAKKESKAQAEARVVELGGEIEQISDQIREIEATIKDAEANTKEPFDMADYAEQRRALEERIRRISEELADLSDNRLTIKGELEKDLTNLRFEISKQTEILGKEFLLEYSRGRIEELREDAKNAAACLDAVERMLALVDDFTRFKTSYVEDSVNGMFRLARFRLFREQANGGIEDRCDVVFDGIPYISLNNGARINVGVDIINTLTRALGVSVPLFIDNAESVTRLEQCNGQIIRLVVSEKDKELRVSYEN